MNAMLKLYIQLMWEFFKTGLFAVGGGLATIPFLYEMMEKFGWFTKSDLMTMIAVGESTPGPIGINMATYVGYHVTGSPLGGILTTVALVFPSVVIICIIAGFLQKFKTNHYVQDVFYGLRACTAGLVAAAGIGVFETTVLLDGTFFSANLFSEIKWLTVFLFSAVLCIVLKWKKLNPILVIFACGLMGIILQL